MSRRQVCACLEVEARRLTVAPRCVIWKAFSSTIRSLVSAARAGMMVRTSMRFDGAFLERDGLLNCMASENREIMRGDENSRSDK